MQKSFKQQQKTQTKPLSEFANKTFGGAVGSLERKEALQRDLDKLEG